MDGSDHPLARRFVLDTSAFVTDEIRRDDESMAAAMARLLDLIRDARLDFGTTCYQPPSIRDELTGILEGRDREEELLASLDAWMIARSPARHDAEIPAELVYGYIDEMADRVNKGLRLAEDAVREAGEASPETVDDSEYVTEVDEVISDLRERYRSALRQDVIDSREDFDLLLLADDLDACIVTEDRGILLWADELGLEYRKGRDFPDLLERYLEAVEDR